MNQLPTTTTMYQALVQKNSRFEGIFFAGIKTTGIFCRPTCTARKPKKENVEYFSTTKDAMAYGYRPCKVCTPMSYSGKAPDWVNVILDELAIHPDTRMKDYDLVKRGIDPSRVRRWFKKEHGITFQAYQRSLRINKAFGTLRTSTSVTETAFDSGFESLSGFQDAFKKNIGFNPSDSSSKGVIEVSRVLTPVGPMVAGTTERGLCFLEFTDRKMFENQIRRIQSKTNQRFLPGKNTIFNELQTQLDEYFERSREEFTIPLDLIGTDFQIRVWEELLRISYGQVRTYAQQAIAIQNQNAVRAVTRANGMNSISILVPCHRVIGSNGKLVGYGGGLHRKKYLLDIERHPIDS